MKLPLDLFSDSDFSDENLHLLPERASQIAQLCCGGRRRSESKNFWEASRVLLGGITSTESTPHPDTGLWERRHNFYTADKIIEESGITDNDDIKELRFQAAAIKFLCANCPDPVKKHGVEDEDTRARLGLKAKEIEVFKKESPRLAKALKWVYRGKKPSSIFVDCDISGEEDRRLTSLKAALFYVQRGAFVEHAIRNADVYEKMDQDRVRFFHGFKSILEGMTTSAVIDRCAMLDPRYRAALTRVGDELDRLEPRSLKRTRNDEDAGGPRKHGGLRLLRVQTASVRDGPGTIKTVPGIAPSPVANVRDMSEAFTKNSETSPAAPDNIAIVRQSASNPITTPQSRSVRAESTGRGSQDRQRG